MRTKVYNENKLQKTRKSTSGRVDKGACTQRHLEYMTKVTEKKTQQQTTKRKKIPQKQ